MRKNWAPIIGVVLVLLVVEILAAVVYWELFSNRPNGPAVAKIRYFDGSLDTIRITDWRIRNGAVVFTTERGWKNVIGVNNVIIIEGDEDSE